MKDPLGKLVITILVGILIVISFNIFLNRSKGIEPKTNEKKFQIIKYYKDGYSCYDKETGYVYFRDGASHKGGYTLMVNKEGKIYKYENWKNTKK